MSMNILKPNPEEWTDIQNMTAEQLNTYQSVLLEQLAALDAREPKNINSESHALWGEEHEELEDLLDEIQDYLDELES